MNQPGHLAVLDEVFARLSAAAPAVPTFTELVDALAAHTLGGKLIRPRLVDLGHRAVTGGPVPERSRAVVDRIGAAFELLHTALIVHDDVIDRDAVRRGRPTLAAAAHTRFADHGVPEEEARHAGAAVGVIGGDVLLLEALRLAADCTPDAPRARAVSAALLDSAVAAAAGELEDVVLSHHRHTGERPDEGRILTMQRLKTAEYTFAAPLRAGALLAGAAPAAADRLAQAGVHLGVAYQVVDDVLGVFGTAEDTGKSTAGDLREGKATVVTLHGGRDPRVAALLDRAAAESATEADFAAARAALLAVGSREHALAVASDQVESALAVLDALDSPALPASVRAEFAALGRDVLERSA